MTWISDDIFWWHESPPSVPVSSNLLPYSRLHKAPKFQSLVQGIAVTPQFPQLIQEFSGISNFYRWWWCTIGDEYMEMGEASELCTGVRCGNWFCIWISWKTSEIWLSWHSVLGAKMISFQSGSFSGIKIKEAIKKSKLTFFQNGGSTQETFKKRKEKKGV